MEIEIGWKLAATLCFLGIIALITIAFSYQFEKDDEFIDLDTIVEAEEGDSLHVDDE